ncbi:MULTISPECIES: hypothetical protein [Rheinheimera]|uniref:hypothetical protein n=1 Tax=Rheinheimera TaxID=67575 RepID=UPI001BFD3A86|nr:MULTISPECIES: hypothetical protein [Rheinheimera]MCS4309264.1 hypothetical protein [Rheinheimera pacifica]
MTTVFGINQHFWAADSRWTFIGTHHFSDAHDTRKAILFDNEIMLYAGDEIAIIVDQAWSMDVIQIDDYLRLMAMVSEHEQKLEKLVIGLGDGSIIDHQDSNLYPKSINNEPIFYLGSGGVHAADFFYYTHRKKKLSNLGCNLEGAMRYASVKDVATGGKRSIDIWQSGRYLVRQMNNLLDEFDQLRYTSYLRTKVDYLYQELEQTEMTKTAAEKRSAFSSTFRAGSFSSQEAGMRKVTMSSVISRIERTAARKAAKTKSPD